MTMLLGAAILGGCGDDTGSGGSAEGGGGSSEDGGGGVGAGSSEYVGYGAVYGNSYPSGSSFVSASFTLARSATCTTEESGDCKYIECATEATTELEYRSAGAVTITGGLREVTLEPDAADEYAFDNNGMSELFTGGETLTVTAEGGDVPAFQLEATAPSVVTLSAPELMPLMVVDRSADLDFAWTGGEAGNVVAVVGITRPDRVTNVICTFEASSGSGTIPASMLSNLDPMETGDVAAVVATVTSEEQTDAGDWQVSFTLATNALTQGGTVASVPATVE